MGTPLYAPLTTTLFLDRGVVGGHGGALAACPGLLLRRGLFLGFGIRLILNRFRILRSPRRLGPASRLALDSGLRDSLLGATLLLGRGFGRGLCLGRFVDFLLLLDGGSLGRHPASAFLCRVN